MAFNAKDYLRDKKPLWCPGCGDYIIMNAIVRTIHNLGWSMDDVCVVAGIGCSGRMSSYIDCNTVHTTHGRALAYATGIKLANPDKHVIVITGDGDGLAIGGNHTIHAARRNVDLKHILINNFIYGLTNSQTSPTTPQGYWTVTAQYGSVDPTFNACSLVTGAGAGFVARATVTDMPQLVSIFEEGFKHKGYSFFDVFSNCHTNFGRKNKMGETMQCMDWLKKMVVNKENYDSLTDEEKRTKFPIGIFINANRPDYCELYSKVREAAQNNTRVQL